MHKSFVYILSIIVMLVSLGVILNSMRITKCISRIDTLEAANTCAQQPKERDSFNYSNEYIKGYHDALMWARDSVGK